MCAEKSTVLIFQHSSTGVNGVTVFGRFGWFAAAVLRPGPGLVASLYLSASP